MKSKILSFILIFTILVCSIPLIVSADSTDTSVETYSNSGLTGQYVFDIDISDVADFEITGSYSFPYAPFTTSYGYLSAANGVLRFSESYGSSSITPFTDGKWTNYSYRVIDFGDSVVSVTDSTYHKFMSIAQSVPDSLSECDFSYIRKDNNQNIFSKYDNIFVDIGGTCFYNNPTDFGSVRFDSFVIHSANNDFPYGYFTFDQTSSLGERNLGFDYLTLDFRFASSNGDFSDSLPFFLCFFQLDSQPLSDDESVPVYPGTVFVETSPLSSKFNGTGVYGSSSGGLFDKVTVNSNSISFSNSNNPASSTSSVPYLLVVNTTSYFYNNVLTPYFSKCYRSSPDFTYSGDFNFTSLPSYVDGTVGYYISGQFIFRDVEYSSLVIYSLDGTDYISFGYIGSESYVGDSLTLPFDSFVGLGSLTFYGSFEINSITANNLGLSSDDGDSGDGFDNFFDNLLSAPFLALNGVTLYVTNGGTVVTLWGVLSCVIVFAFFIWILKLVAGG